MKPSKYLIACELTDSDLAKVKALFDGLGANYTTALLIKDIPDAEQLVFRFELFFDGEYQGVGLLQGLEDACGRIMSQRLTRQFKNELPVPLDLPDGCSFWFKKKGLLQFAAAIDGINVHISETGWEVRGCFLWIHETDILYEDDLQVAIGRHAIDETSFLQMARAEELIQMAEEAFK